MLKHGFCQTYMLPLFFVTLLTIPICQPRAQDVCTLLNQVIAGVDDTPPFASVQFVSAPNADCAVGDFEQHESRGAEGIRFAGHNQEHWMCIWNDANLENVLEQEDRAADTYFDLDVDDPGHDQAEAHYKQLGHAVARASKNLYSQARSLASAIQNCISAEQFLRKWNRIKERTKYYSDRRFNSGRWMACQSQGPVCIVVYAVSRYHQIRLDVWENVTR